MNVQYLKQKFQQESSQRKQKSFDLNKNALVLVDGLKCVHKVCLFTCYSCIYRQPCCCRNIPCIYFK